MLKFLWQARRKIGVFLTVAVVTTFYMFIPTPLRQSVQTTFVQNRTTRKYISVELVGYARLGNLMFGHASMLGMATRNGLDPVVSTKNDKLIAAFDLKTTQQKLKNSDWIMCEERFASRFDDVLNQKILQTSGNVLLFGYFQSWRYFDNIRDIITKEFTFKSHISSRASSILNAALEKHYPTVDKQNILKVGVHVRLGDMASQSSFDKGFTVASPEYIRRAMEYMESRLNETLSHTPLVYIVVSDDMAWCQGNIKSSKHPIEFVAGRNEPAVDLAVVASCNHTIITVGTFSWWAGYLSDGITIYYKDFPRPNTPAAAIFLAEDYFHPSWIGLS